MSSEYELLPNMSLLEHSSDFTLRCSETHYLLTGSELRNLIVELFKIATYSQDSALLKIALIRMNEELYPYLEES